MAFCIKCGKQLTEGAKFCANCGTPVNIVNLGNTNQAQRAVVYDGEVHKCPSCGEVMPPLTLICPSCGYEMRSTEVNSSVREFSLRLTQSENDAQAISLIRNFPIPNTKEDITEFIILAASNFNAEHSLLGTGMQKAISDAWYVKFEQCYQKAILLFKDDVAFAKIKEIYSQGKQSIAKVKRRENLRGIFSLILRNILRNIATFVGLIVVVIAVMIDQHSGNSSMAELIGCVVLIASVCSLRKRAVSMIDFAIGALSGVLTIMLSCLLSNGSMLEFGGGIVLVIVAVNASKSTRQKKPKGD